MAQAASHESHFLESEPKSLEAIKSNNLKYYINKIV